MLEIPEAQFLARQIADSLGGKTIRSVTANHSPHKFAWYHGEPTGYNNLLAGKPVDSAQSYGGLIELRAENIRLVFGDGIALSLIAPGGKLPDKHQLLIEFADGFSLVASVRMYGGMWCFEEGDFQNSYYDIAKEKVSPLEEGFSWQYFCSLVRDSEKLSAKAFLATEQRIPGLGNGVLQDILYNARIHPKRKVASLSAKELKDLYTSIKSTLREMTDKGGRDTEKDLYGNSGGYITILSKNTVNCPCPACSTPIRKEAYMGGSIYYCPSCQPLP